MIKTSLTAFKIKPKPGSSIFNLNSFYTKNGSSMGMFPRTIRRFSSASELSIDPRIEEEVMRIAREFLKDIKYSKPYRLTPKATLSSLGLDSLDTIDLIIEFEEKMNIDLSNLDAETRIKTIRDAVVVFSEYANKKSTVASVILTGNQEQSLPANLL